ncbi:MAG: beta-ketoacyl-[acyl-carrier-protein] synthase family protein [Pirellulales bacterium]|nr:beta-ketoacyl-[acyl-carrier-protein] synthase family protein [Pirellulales bacterium]
MRERPSVVITGVGIVSPLGIGRERFWQSIVSGRSGVALVKAFDSIHLPARIAAEVRDFEPKEFVRPRKSLKVMARDSQFAVACSDLALADAGIAAGQLDPDRFGVVLGADRLRNELTESAPTYHACAPEGTFEYERWATDGFSAMYPLGFLKVLPNMPACHISILHDARGANNTLHQGELSTFLAVAEAQRLIERGGADVVITGGVSSRMHPIDYVRRCLTLEMSHRNDRPELASRPFDRERDGQVFGEGGAVFVLESEDHAEARRAKILGRVLGYGGACEPLPPAGPITGVAIAQAIRATLADARISPAELGHVSAHGLSTRHDDRVEAVAIHETLGDVPVLAPKSYFGNLGAAAGAVELAVNLLALEAGVVPPTLNVECVAPECPIDVVRHRSLAGRPATALLLSHTAEGQSAGLLLAGA